MVKVCNAYRQHWLSAANMAYTETFGVPAIPSLRRKHSNCSAIRKELKAKPSNGFGPDSDAIHRQTNILSFLLKGIETIPLFYKYFVELSK
jgi:hypothetical protein